MEASVISEARVRAERRVSELQGFYSHLTSYCLVNAGLFALNMLVSPHHWWFYWAAFGWGIGVACHGFSILKIGLFGKSWCERKIKRIMAKEGFV